MIFSNVAPLLSPFSTAEPTIAHPRKSRLLKINDTTKDTFFTHTSKLSNVQ